MILVSLDPSFNRDFIFQKRLYCKIVSPFLTPQVIVQTTSALSFMFVWVNLNEQKRSVHFRNISRIYRGILSFSGLEWSPCFKRDIEEKSSIKYTVFFSISIFFLFFFSFIVFFSSVIFFFFVYYSHVDQTREIWNALSQLSKRFLWIGYVGNYQRGGGGGGYFAQLMFIDILIYYFFFIFFFIIIVFIFWGGTQWIEAV